jgi:hypothetical protein
MIFSLAAKWVIVVKSVETAKKLNKDYGLVEAEELDKNLKQFLAHIGKSISNIYQDDYLLTDPKSLSRDESRGGGSRHGRLGLICQSIKVSISTDSLRRNSDKIQVSRPLLP